MYGNQNSIMKKTILNKLQVLDVKLENLLEDLQAHSHEALNQKPSADSWSAVQVMYHLMLSEKYSLQYCKKKLGFKPTLEKAGIGAKLRSLFVQGYLLLPLKAKAPKAVASPMLPEEGDLVSIAKKWRAQRRELEDFFNSLPAEYLDKEVYKHPMVGRLSFIGMLDFIGAHFKSHQKQIFRTILKYL